MTYKKSLAPDRVAVAAHAAKGGRPGPAAAKAMTRANALTRPINLDDSDLLDAEIMARRVANRHGCVFGDCPDPVAHVADVEALSVLLGALGLGGAS